MWTTASRVFFAGRLFCIIFIHFAVVSVRFQSPFKKESLRSDVYELVHKSSRSLAVLYLWEKILHLGHIFIHVLKIARFTTARIIRIQNNPTVQQTRKSRLAQLGVGWCRSLHFSSIYAELNTSISSSSLSLCPMCNSKVFQHSFNLVSFHNWWSTLIKSSIHLVTEQSAEES